MMLIDSLADTLRTAEMSVKRLTQGEIVAEIRRTAIANGGAPLGVRRFQQETGIRISDWFGWYWSTWGDAQREAGLRPTRMQSQKWHDDDLIEKLVACVEALGHFPVKGELRLMHRQDRSFPTDRVFDRLGEDKAAVAERVRQYCEAREDLRELVPLCVAARARGARRGSRARDAAVAFGSVYLAKSGRYYKIGRTNATGRREYELALQMPERLQAVHVIRTDDPVGIEAYWHQRFASKRKNGEWFDLDPNEVSAFKRRKFM